jgi:hypothetical protein
VQHGLVLGVAAGSWEEQVRESEGLGLSLLIQRLYIIVRILNIEIDEEKKYLERRI